ncbi:MAG TPA: hypothetical protein VD993_15490 [Chitinophagaceae bacterium]|nr:hypothetical protein [Chitinophagaceae bacterium]
MVLVSVIFVGGLVALLLFLRRIFSHEQPRSNMSMLSFLGASVIMHAGLGLLFQSAMSGDRWIWENLRNNLAHHFFVHQGFQDAEGEPLQVAGNKATALFPSLEGRFSISHNPGTEHCTLAFDSFPYPIYTSHNGAWMLAQAMPNAVATDQALIIRGDGQPEQLGISIKQGEKDNEFGFIIAYAGQSDTLAREKIAYGNSLFRILEKTTLPLPEILLSHSKMIYLLKDSLGPKEKNNTHSRLKWFAGKQPGIQYWQTVVPASAPLAITLRQGDNIIDLLGLSLLPGTHQLQYGSAFYIGIDAAGGRSFAGQAAFTVCKVRDSLLLEYKQAPLYTLPGNSNDMPGTFQSVFINTHADSALLQDNLAGYILPTLNNAASGGNVHHINAQVDFRAGKTGHGLRDVKVYPFAARDEDDPIRTSADSTWNISDNGGVNWRFSFLNSFINARTEYGDFFWALFVFHLVFIGAYLWIYKKPSAPSPLMVWALVHVALYCFLLRIFLLWRIDSFPPSEGINHDFYKSIVEGTPQYGRTLLLALACYVTVMSVFWLICMPRTQRYLKSKR